MKLRLFSLFAATALFAACQNAPKADEATVGEAQEVKTTSGETYPADLTQSTVQFTGTKPVGQHMGVFMLKEGSLMVDGKNVTGGRFVADISTMKITDKDTNKTSMLRGHLMGPDFFDAEKYPNASFEITNVTPGAPAAKDGEELMMKDATHTITGNLMLKDTTRSITFPAKVQMADGQVVADANFNIDRTQWHMVYGNDKGLGDKFIRPEVNIVLHLVAKK